MSLEYGMPESFLGAVAGFEGVKDGFTAIHGPTGCKFYPASVSESSYVRDRNVPRSLNLLAFGSLYFFGQPRVPCTYLDMATFVDGARGRLDDMMCQISKLKPAMVAVVNSPGASLVGEDLSAVTADVPVAVMDHAEYSGTAADGFQDAVLSVLDAVGTSRGSGGLGVCLTGLSVLHQGWKDTFDDLAHLLEACGVRVGPCIGAGWTVEDVGRSGDADLVVPVYPEYGDRIAERYSGMGVPVFVPDGAPIGFPALESWIRGVCSAVGADPSPALGIVAAKRRRTAEVLLLLEARHSLPRSRTFSVECDGSVAYSIVRFLYSYLGMIPVAVGCTSGKAWERRIREFLDSKGIPVSDDPEETRADILISSGPVCSAAVERGIVSEAYPIQPPSPRTISIDPAPALGLGGTVRLLEAVLETVADHQRFRRSPNRYVRARIHLYDARDCPVMTILSDRDIVAAIDEGKLGVGPWNDRSLTPNGYDLRVAEISVNGVVHGADEGTVKIPPRTTFFVSTVERVRFPDDMCGNLWLRTSWIRKGVISAFGMVDAGFEGTLTLGSYNSSESEIEIPIGERYCQLVFHTMSSSSEKSYEKRSGHYQNQTGVTLTPKNP